jgi:PAS domain S-box-containing protein
VALTERHDAVSAVVAPTATPGFGRADWVAVCHRALLHHVSRGSALGALSLLRDGILADNRRDAAIAYAGHGRSLQWVGQAAPPALVAQGALIEQWLHAESVAPVDGWWLLPLEHLSRCVGLLCMQRRAGDTVADFEPLAECAAVLIAQTAHGGSAVALSQAETLRAALRGAGTFAWEWNVENDSLPDIAEGFAMLGYPLTQRAFTQEDWTQLIHPDERAANHAAYLRHERGEVDQYEHVYRALDAHGEWRWIHERGRIVERTLDGRPRRMLGTQADVTRRQALEASVSQATQRLHRIASHVPGVLFQLVQSADGLRAWFPFVSERCRAVFGLEPAALVNDASLLFRKVDRDWRERVVSSVLAASKSNSQWQLEFPVHRVTGQPSWMLGVATPHHEADGSVTWSGYIADVTDRRELEAARRDKATAEAASRTKTEFLSRMSHELRTPLNAVIGFAQLLELGREPPLADTQRRHVGLIRQAGEHLLHMISDLLDLTSIEAGHVALQWQAVDLSLLADECLALVQGQATAASVTVFNDLRGRSAVNLRADRTRLKQVLINLLSNAVKYNRPGGSVQLRGTRQAESWRIDVVDTGQGIDAAHLTTLFKPFQRGAHARSTIEGTGIGLAVSQSLVELMGGRIEVSSVPGDGSVFSVILPA